MFLYQHPHAGGMLGHQQPKHNMQKIALGLALALSLVATGAMAKGPQRSATDTAKEISRATETAVKTYKANGVSGLISDSADCWEKGARPYCLYVDMSGDMVDAIMAGGIGAPENSYFDPQNITQRGIPLFERMSLEDSQINEYLQAVSTAVGASMRKQFGIK